MSNATEDRVRAAYERAVQEHLQKCLRTAEDWDRYNAIVAETQDRLANADTSFAWDFEARMAEARQIVLREEHGLAFDQPLPPGIDPRSPPEIETQAEARVYRDHERRKAAIQSDATDTYVDLTAELRARDAPDPSPSLTQTSTRGRSGPSRS